MSRITKDLDLFEDIPISFNYAVQDIRTPDKRDSAYTKTIKIPGTSANNDIFSKVFDIGYIIQSTGTTQYGEGDFNPNLKLDVVVQVDSIEQFRGHLKLDRIVRDDWNNITYECTLYGKLKSFWSSMGDNKLTDLDFSAYDHTYTTSNISASWSPAVVGQRYVYPMINNGFGTMTNTQVEWWKPAIFLKEYVDKIFMQSGYQYSSSFFNTNFFKSLIIPCSSDRLRLSYDTVALSEARASRSSTQTINVTFVNGNQVAGTTGKVVLFNDDSTTPNSDAGSQYTPASGVFTSTNTRRYNVRAVCDVRYLFTPSGATTSNAKMRVSGRILKFNSQGNTQSYANGYATHVFDFTSEGTINPADTTGTIRLDFKADNILVKAGEKIQVQILQVNLPTGSLPFPKPMYNSGGGTLDLQILSDSYMEVKVSDASLMAGDTVEMSNAVPEDIRQADLMSSIIRTFNLYIEEDKRTPNKLIIEPFVDYYSSGTTLDWTEKLDISQPFTIDPMALLEGRRYRLAFTEDNDYLNDFYKKRYNETYGQKNVDINNDWVTDIKEIKPLFAPTPSEQTLGTDRVIPAIYTLDSNNAPQPKASKPRLICWGGLTTTNAAFSIYDNSTGIKNTFTQYPYSGHLDSISNPDYDVNFWHPREVFWNATTYTTGNLYNEYWKQYIDEITDPNSKLVTGYFWLTPSDIHQLDFRNKIFVNGQTYRINRIIDYNPVVSQLTKVELIKVKYGLQFSGRRKPSINAGGGSFGDTNPIYSTNRLLGLNENSSSNPDNLVNGSRNFVAYNTSGVTILGSEGCSVLGECSNVGIYNSSGCTVMGGLENVSIYNSSGVTVTQSNISYEYNEPIPQQDEKIKYVNEEQYYIKLYEKALINTKSDSGINWYLPSEGMTKGQEYVVKNSVTMSGSYTCTLNGNGYLIDGSSTLLFTNRWSSYVLRFTGEAWVIVSDLTVSSGTTITGLGVANRMAYWGTASNLISSANITTDGNSITVGTSVITPIIIGSTSASGTITIRATSSGTDGNILFETDPTTERARILSTGEFIVGATTLVGSEIFSIQKNQNATTQATISNSTDGTASRTALGIATNGGVGLSLLAIAPSFTTVGISVASTSVLQSNSLAGFNIGTIANTQLSFWTNNTERARVLGTGEFLVGYSALASAEVFGVQKNQNTATYALVSNTTSGTAARAAFYASNSATGATGISMESMSAGYTTSGIRVADASAIVSSKAAGLNIGTVSGAYQLSFWTFNTKRVEVSGTGQFIAYAKGTTTSTSTSVTFTSAHYGLEFLWSPSGTATATLPANGAAAGSWFIVTVLTDQTTTISAATADTLIVKGDTTADSIAFSTASNKIGASVKFISNGSVWIAINISDCTMTVAT